MNEIKQSHWSLLQHPRWKPLLGFAVVFAVLLLTSRISLSSPLQIGVIFLTALGYILICDSVRLLIGRYSFRPGLRVTLACVGFGLAQLLGLLITHWGGAAGAPRFIVASVRYSVVLGISLGCGTALARPRIARSPDA